MKTYRLLLVAIFLAVGAVLPERILAQQVYPDTLRGLQISADGWLSTNDRPRLHFIIHLLNTTNHNITVLTKKKDSVVSGGYSSDRSRLEASFSFSPFFKWADHTVVPSLPEYAPVTLKPNEAALCYMDIEQIIDVKSRSLRPVNGLTRDLTVSINYDVSQDWEDKFNCWSGWIQTKPFHIK